MLQFAGDRRKRYNTSFQNGLYYRTCRVGQWFEYGSGREEHLLATETGSRRWYTTDVSGRVLICTVGGYWIYIRDFSLAEG